ncbi:NAD(P)-binding domain-containing protein [Paenibacillus larvae]|uniref:NAD(P)-binding domain-containing protein n=1 Tax=Paenibacillus larvae TaxID=1464 RepID=UPI0028BEAF01|nr:NAD(P)-binding domain-containing protein [Paenibacillus larvae]
MAEAIIQGLIEKQKAGPGHICVMNNQNKQRLHELQERYGAGLLRSLRRKIRWSRKPISSCLP